MDYLYADAAELRRIVTDLLASNAHTLRLLAEAEARAAGLEATVHDLQRELAQARELLVSNDGESKHE